MFGFCKGVAYVRSVLMTANAAQRIKFAVKIKSFFRVYRICAETEIRAYFVNLFTVNFKRCNRFIKIRVFKSVPKARLLYNRCFAIFQVCNFIAVAVENFYFRFAVAHGVSGYCNVSVAVFYGRVDFNRVTAVKIQIEAACVNANKIYVPVYAAVKGEVGALRINFVVNGVIRYNLYFVFVF